MPHILSYVHAYVPKHNAGAETTLHDILKLLISHGWTATVMLSKPGEDYTHEGVDVVHYRADDHNAFNRASVACDVIISHLDCSERAVYVAREAGVPVVQLIHNTLWQTEGYLGLGCDLAIYNTEWVADHHREALSNPMIRVLTKLNDDLIKVDYRVREGGTRFPSVVVHPLVNPHEYRTSIDAVHDCIGFVNFFENKNPKVFYEMARRFPEHKFLGLKGGYGKQEMQDGFDNVYILENTPNIRDDFYSRLRVLLVPSEYESFGRVAIEAASSGIPTVATPTPGLLEALGHRGVYADYDDMDMWESRLREVLNCQSYYRQTSINTSSHWYNEATYEKTRLMQAMNKLVK